MDTLIFLQNYWWFIISLLGALLVFMMFVQGGQGLLLEMGRTSTERELIVASMGRKWELTFTLLVVFGGAFFAAFPLFYSTSFGGAFYVWMLILLVFVIQAVAYEFRRKPSNLFGEKTYDCMLMINGLAGPLLLGMAFGTLFTGAPFTVDRMNMALTGGAVSQWATPWHGLDALADIRNWLFGILTLSLSRVLAMHYFINNINCDAIRRRAAMRSIYNAIPLFCSLILFVGMMCQSTGASFGYQIGIIAPEKQRFMNTFIEMPVLMAMFFAGVVLIGTGIYTGAIHASRRAIWFSGTGTVVLVLSLLLSSGWNNSCYYISTVDLQSSLNISNSSSSELTLRVMSWVSLLIPFVLGYIWYVWRRLNAEPLSERDVRDAGH